jgi:hypothetical protein
MSPDIRPAPQSSMFAGCLVAFLMLAALVWTVFEVVGVSP